MVLAAALFASVSARAAGLVVRPAYGRAPVELVFEGQHAAGRFLVENRGSTPITVEVKPRSGSKTNPRLPPDVHAAFQDNDSRATLAPGASQSVMVRWDLPRQHRLWQLFGQVLVRRVDPGSHDPALAMGIHCQVPLSFGWLFYHLASWLLLVPLIGAAVVAAAALGGFRKPRALGVLALCVTLVELALTVVTYANFRPWVTRWGGNDGYQFIEHARLLPSLGVEYSLGIDGLSLSLLLLSALVAVVAMLVSFRIAKKPGAYFALLLLFEAVLMGVFMALDVALLLAFWIVAAASAVLLVAGWGRAGSRNAAFRSAVALGLATLLIGAAFAYLSKHAGPSYLVGGSPAPRTFALSELMHADFVGPGLLIWRHSAVAIAYGALFVGFGLILALVPLHGWLLAALERGPSGAAILICAALLDVGAYGLLRVGYGVLPQGTLWAAHTLAVAGVIAIYYGGLGALMQTDLRRFVGYASVGHVGFALVGLSSLTAIGVQGCLTVLFSHGLSVALLLGTAEALSAREGAELDGLARRMPWLAALAAVGLLVSLGMPGSSGFVGELEAIVGALPEQAPFAVLAAIGIVFVGLAHVRVLGRLLGGSSSESDATPSRLSARELAALVPLALLALLLGVWPRPLLRVSDSSALDYASRVQPPGPLQIARVRPRPAGRLADVAARQVHPRS
jgi:NADH-quinone oxidoreductase subunit M